MSVVRLRALLKKLHADQRGSVATMAGLSFPIVLGFAGLAVETSVWYGDRANMQSAADMAAHAAAVELSKKGLDQDLADAVAIDQASEFGYEFSEVTTLATEDASGIKINVDITRESKRYFSSLFHSGPVKQTLKATSVVESAGEACLLALDPNGDGVDLGGNTGMTMNNCLVASNATSDSSLSVTGSATLTTACAGVVGGADIQKKNAVTFSDCTQTREGIAPVTDPYADLGIPDLDDDDFEDCVSAGGNGKKKSLLPLGTGRYCGGLTFSGVQMIEDGATLVIDGGTFKNQGPASLLGNNVTIILINDATISMTSQATFDLTAKSTGDYAGLIFMGDAATQSTSHKFNGGSMSRLRGAVYLPSDELELRGGANMNTGCSHFIAAEIDALGNSRMSNNCDGVGTKPLVVTGGVRMVKS